MTTEPARAPRPPFEHLLVDRDGVLNVEAAHGWVVDDAGWDWEPGALEALSSLAAAGVGVSIVTNQSCIGRGVASAAQVAALHDRVAQEVHERCGLDVTVYVCPHTDQDACGCRKPAPGLLLQAIDDHQLRPAAVLMVGDAERDLEAGRRAGVATALVRTGKGAEVDAGQHDLAASGANLLDLVESIFGPRPVVVG